IRCCAFGRTSASASAPLWKNASLFPPVITSVGMVAVAQRLAGNGLPLWVSLIIIRSYGNVCATDLDFDQLGINRISVINMPGIPMAFEKKSLSASLRLRSEE